jgi:putative DNA primase/helicase
MISAETIRAALRCGVPGCKCGTSKTDVHCPAHNSDKANFSVSEKNGKILVHCQAGCFQAQVIEALKARNLWPANNGGPPKFKIIKAYDYVDAAGKMVFQSCRLDPKDFRQRRPDGSGGWIWKMAGVQLVPYRLPELLNSETIYIVEAEKDCDNLAALGLVATTNVGGAGKWRDAYNTHFQGKVVAIIPDNDSPSRAHAQEVAQHLQGVAAVVRILELPGLPEKGDVSDWLKAGGTVEQLKERANAAADWEPQEPAPEPEPGVQGDPAKISWIGHNYFVENGRLCLEQFDRKGLPRTSALANL